MDLRLMIWIGKLTLKIWLGMISQIFYFWPLPDVTNITVSPTSGSHQHYLAVLANFETYKAMTRKWNLIGCVVILQEAIIEGRDLMGTIRRGLNLIPIVFQTLTNIGVDLTYQMVETDEVFQKPKHN